MQELKKEADGFKTEINESVIQTFIFGTFVVIALINSWSKPEPFVV